MRFLWPTLQGLNESQSQLFILMQAVVRKFAERSMPPLADVDIAEATQALAATFETADKGIIYEHQPTSLQAQGLTTELRSTLAEVAKNPSSSVQRQMAEVLRRVEHGARTAEQELGEGGRSYLQVLERLPQPPRQGEGVPAGAGSEAGSAGDDTPPEPTGSRSPLIIP